jgi:hypothetical protein
MDLQLLGGVLGILINIPLIVIILSGKTRQSFTTYILWALLDMVAAEAIYEQQGNYWLPFFYGIGAGIAALCLLFKKQFSWGILDSVILILVIVCIAIQQVFGEWWAMIASVASLIIASIPQIINSWEKPKDTPFWIYLGFSFAGLISMLGGKSFELKEILYPLTALMICGIIAILSKRK